MERAKNFFPVLLHRATANRSLFALAIILIVILPCAKADIVPFVDLIAFSHLNSYPRSLSYGPEHYYVVELTYILPHLLSRILLDSGVTANQQIFYYYALQVLFGAGLASVVIRRFEGNNRAGILLQIWGALVVYDGLFLWGGPLAWSLNAIPIIGMFVLATRKYPYSDSAMNYPAASGGVSALQLPNCFTPQAAGNQTQSD